MDANEIRELLPLYVIGALDEREYAEIRQYLSDHPEMKEELMALEDTAVKIDDINMKAPEGILEDIMEKISEPEPSLSEKIKTTLFTESKFQRFAFAALILVCLAIGGNLIIAPGIHSSVALSGTQNASGASGSLTIYKNLDTALLSVKGLPELSKGKEYQLWLIKRDGKRTSGAIFSAKDGRAKVNVKSKLPITEYFAFGITIEPAGGSPTPTGKKVLGS